jgi:hypothetical protein
MPPPCLGLTPSHPPTACRDGKHVVFGQVVEGLDVVKKVESYGSQSGKTSQTITISDCGQLSVRLPLCRGAGRPLRPRPLVALPAAACAAHLAPGLNLLPAAPLPPAVNGRQQEHRQVLICRKSEWCADRHAAV